MYVCMHVCGIWCVHMYVYVYVRYLCCECMCVWCVCDVSGVSVHVCFVHVCSMGYVVHEYGCMVCLWCVPVSVHV